MAAQQNGHLRAFRVGVAGPVGSGKTALVERLSRRLAARYSLAVVTNDIYTREDAEFLMQQLTQPDRALWGVSALPAHGLALRGLSASGRDIASGLLAFWRASRLALDGQTPVPPRKIY